MMVTETLHDLDHQEWIKHKFNDMDTYGYVLWMRHEIRQMFMQYCLAVVSEVNSDVILRRLNQLIENHQERQGDVEKVFQWKLQDNSGLDTTGVKFDYYNGLDPIDKETAEKLVMANSKEMYKSHYGHDTGWKSYPYEETEK